MTARSSLVVEMSGDEADLKRKQAAVIAQTEQMKRGYGAVGNEARRGEQELRRFADRMTRINATPLEKYHRKQEQLNEALKRGLITQQTHARATAHARDELDKATRSSDQHAQKLQQADRDLRRFADDMKRVNATPLERAREKQQKLNEALRRGYISQQTHARATRQNREALEAASRATDQNAQKTDLLANGLGSIKQAAVGMATTFLGAGGANMALQLFRESLEFAREETQRAAETIEELTDARRRLNQIAMDSEDLATLEQQADQRAARFGVDRQTVRNLQFSARSEGFEESVDDILASRFVVDPLAAATAAGQIPQLFKGAVSPTEAINATIAGARQSRLDFEEITRALPRAAEGAGAAGSSPAEAISLLSVLASEFATGNTAADRIKAFGTRLSLDERFEGLGVVEATKKLQAMPDEERAEFLGNNQELNSAYRKVLANLDTITARTAEVQQAISTAGTEDSLLAQGRRRALDTTTEAGRSNAATLTQQRARIAREIANERQQAETGAATAAARDTEVARLKTEDRSLFDQFVASRAADAAAFLQLGPAATQTAAETGGHLGRNLRYQATTALFPGVGAQLATLEQTAEELRARRAGDRRDRPPLDARDLLDPRQAARAALDANVAAMAPPATPGPGSPNRAAADAAGQPQAATRRDATPPSAAPPPPLTIQQLPPPASPPAADPRPRPSADALATVPTTAATPADLERLRRAEAPRIAAELDPADLEKLQRQPTAADLTPNALDRFTRDAARTAGASLRPRPTDDRLRASRPPRPPAAGDNPNRRDRDAAAPSPTPPAPLDPGTAQDLLRQGRRQADAAERTADLLETLARRGAAGPTADRGRPTVENLLDANFAP